MHQLHLDNLERYYLPLPKLNARQVEFLLRNLQDRGFRTRAGSRLLRITAGATAVSVDPAGLSWSHGELLDAIAPAIPSLLAFAKGAAANARLDPRYVYFSAKKVRGRLIEFQFFTRMESLRTWTELRRVGLCGLTPDEKAVIESLLEGAEGTVECVTDYFSEKSSPILIGRRLYYRSTISVDEFAATLRTVSQSSQRNSYLPRESILRMTTKDRFEFRHVFEGLGEWCYVDYSSKNL